MAIPERAAPVAPRTETESSGRPSGTNAPDPTAGLPQPRRSGNGPGRRSALLGLGAVLLLVLLSNGGAPLRAQDAGGDETGRAAPGESKSPATIRVLYVEGAPRWEYRYVKNALLRQQAIRLQAFLCGAEPSFRQEHSDGLPALESLPRSAADLADYDVVLIGDVRPESVGATATERTAWIHALAAFVRAGGGVAFLCGDNGMPESWRGTELAELLPVTLAAPSIAVEVPAEGIAPQLTSAGIGHPTLQLADSPVMTGQVLCDVRFRSWVPLGPARDAATVLLLGPEARPLVAVGTVGRGRTLVTAVGDSWRLREPHGDVYHDRLWRQIVRWLAGGDDRTGK